MPRILVTGAAGFVGSFVFDRFSRDGHEVFGTTTGLPTDEKRYCNIEDQASVAALLHDLEPEILIHCAAISSVTSGLAMDYYRVNTVGTQNLMEAFAKMPRRQRFLFVSTAGVYGNQDAEILHEGLCPKPVHHYGMSKFCAERVLANYADQIDYAIIRPFNIIGEGQNAEFIVPKLVDAFHNRVPVVRLGNLDVYRDYIDIMDAVEILTKLAFEKSARGETVNLCSGSPISINDLIAGLQDITGHNIQVEVAPEFVRRNEVWRLLGDTEKLEKMMGGKLQFRPINQTLRRMLGVKSSDGDLS
jgi:nucleoside-diphosphate-sugar epimerase